MLRPSRLYFSVVAAAFFMAWGSAMAQQAAPSGSWSGSLRNDGNARVRVDAQFNANGVSLHVADPYGCRIDAMLVETASDGTYYSFRPSTNGGAFCDQLFPGELVAAPATDAGLPVSLTNGNVRWAGTLRAAASP